MSFSLAPVVLAASLVAQSPQPAPPAAASGPPATAAFALPDARGLIEGIAFRPKTGAYYFGDVHLRCVWLRTPDGRVTRFSAPDDRLLGVFRVAVDEARGALWVSMGALEQMDGFAAKHKGAGGLAELDLATGAVRRVVMAPDDGAPHLLGDFVQLADGTVYATDTTSPVIWTLAPGRQRAGAARHRRVQVAAGHHAGRGWRVGCSSPTIASACSTSTSRPRRSAR